MKTNIVGTRIGIFDILCECPHKANDGHRLYRIKCCKCGWETESSLGTVKKLSKNCTHINDAGQYIYSKAKLKWKNSRLKNIYRHLIQRCYTPTDNSYVWYGGKGIKVCDEWLHNPLEFENWALSNGYKDNLTIDRIDCEKNYSPDNCRWISASDNARFKSTTTCIIANNEIHSGREWAYILNLGTNTINLMLRKYPLEQVVNFIEARLKDKTKDRKSGQTWMEVYNI